MASGTAKVGSIPAEVLGPIDLDTFLQNQSPQKMLVWLDGDVEGPPIELPPYQRIMVPIGSTLVMAQAPMARPGQFYRLFYSSVEAPAAAITQG